MNIFGDLSFSFVMELYRIKQKALKAKDLSAISSLKLTYPSIFTDEFENFISNLRAAIEHLKLQYRVNFDKILDDQEDIDHSLLH